MRSKWTKRIKLPIIVILVMISAKLFIGLKVSKIKVSKRKGSFDIGRYVAHVFYFNEKAQTTLSTTTTCNTTRITTTTTTTTEFVPPPVKRNFTNTKGVLGEAIRYSAEKPDEVIRSRFQLRLDTLNQTCPKEAKNSKNRLKYVNNPYFISIPEKRVVVCVVGKCGSTSWRELAWNFHKVKINNTGRYHYKYIHELQRVLTKLRPGERDKLMKEVPNLDRHIAPTATATQNHRLVLTRHPFGRLISAWNEKFRYSSNLWLKRDELLRSYKKINASGHDMAWQDFARYIADNGPGNNVHFMPVSKMCNVCNYSYTYVVKTESFDEDALWMMRRLNISEYEILHRNVPPEGSKVNNNPSTDIGKLMSTLSKSVGMKLYKIYKNDFKHFGYTFDFDKNLAGGFDMD